jgi:hypothetical protein
VQVGQVGQVGQVESIPFVLSYIKSPLFIAECFSKSGHFDLVKLVAKDRSELISNASVRFQAKFNVEANILELKLRANSPEVVKFALDSIVSELKNRHTEMMKPALDLLNSTRSSLESQVATDKKTIKNYSSVNKYVDFKSNNNIVDTMVIANQINSINSSINSNQQYLNSISIALLAPNTVPTHAISDVLVNKAPVSPNLLFIITLSSILGLILARVLVFVLYKR